MLLEHFTLLSLSLLHKISSGTIYALKCAQTQRNEYKKCEYFAGDLVGCNSEDEFYKRLVRFMIVGLKNSIPYVIKSYLETKINADWQGGTYRWDFFKLIKTLKVPKTCHNTLIQIVYMV